VCICTVFLLAACATVPQKAIPTWETLSDVAVTDIQVQLTGQRTDDGQVWFSGKATVSNTSKKRLTIDTDIQGVDADNFEQENFYLEASLGPGESRVLTNRGFTPEANFRKVVRWQLRKARYLVE
jgi:hypothetical protein